MEDDVARRPRVLSGIAATGTLHIGNYIGALSVWAQEQDAYDNYFMIADLHALTIPENVQAGRVAGTDSGECSAVCGVWARPRPLSDLPAVRRERTCDARLGARLRDAGGLARADDAVQVQGGGGERDARRYRLGVRG